MITVEWNEIPSSVVIYLEPKLIKELITEGIRRSGSKRQLVKFVLLHSGRSPDVTFLEKIMNGEKGIVKFRLERLLFFLHIRPEKIIDKIIKIRSRRQQKK